MVGALRKHAPVLRAMANCSPAMRKGMVKAADPSLVRCLCECALNILKGNVPLSPTHKRSLGRRKKDLRALASRRGSITGKKRILQKGGFIGSLLAALGTLLPIGRTITKAFSGKS